MSCQTCHLNPTEEGAYPSFCSVRPLGVLCSPLGGMLVHRRVTPSIKISGSHLCTWAERGTVRVKRLAQEHNSFGLLDLEASALTMRLSRLLPTRETPEIRTYELLIKGSMRTQTYLRLSLVSAENRRQPEIRLRSQAT